MGTDIGGTQDEIELTIPGTCPTCGFDPEQVGPDGAAEVLQELPGRWRTALAVHLDDGDPEGVLAGRPTAQEWTALEHAGHVRDVVHALDLRLHRVLREDEPTLPFTHVTPPAGANEQGAAVVLAALTVSTDQMAGTITSIPAGAWGRVGRRGAGTVTALDLVREAVHEGTHHLHLATSTLRDLRSSASTAVS